MTKIRKAADKKWQLLYIS